MRRALVLLTLLVGACQAGPPGFKPVDYPAEPQQDWIRASAVGSKLTPENPTADQLRTFAGEDTEVVDIRAAALPDDFYGSTLFDGFDFTLQPLDATNHTVKKLGHLSITLYTFEASTFAGRGVELMRWHVPASRMQHLWETGFVDGSYHLKLAWTRRPDVDYVKMEVHFTTLDGKTFTTLITPSSIDQPRYRWLEK
ncbi:MAG TPA: hypothetical protein VMX57_06115 [Planctomycetota bacterium]|nr:hypothetical protein [Planctomycetota bacterium]